MRLFAIGIERALDVTIERPHDADAREHRRAAKTDDEQKSFHHSLPFWRREFALGGSPVM
jgi:hypothetical protein